jgi:hypothetical protein
MRSIVTLVRSRTTLCAIAAIVVHCATSTGVHAADREQIKFNRDIRPILSQNCFKCHGPDKDQREAELRLDTKEGLFGPVSGGTALIAGKPNESAVIRRIKSTDPDERMPPPDSGKKLTADEIARLERWVQNGAEWEGHWAYIPPTRPEIPMVDPAIATHNDIDRFVQAKLGEMGLRPAAEADRVTLIRRLSFDLIGLPPKPEEVDAFLNDQSDGAYERLVDRLLSSPHYGERMAMYWLDLVRFADTIGYHSDNPRNITAYRDYVIKAFNENKPYSDFTVEQLAGDLIPMATTEQKTASGYNRLLMTTEEGGAQPKEYAAKYMADRVRNVSAVWLGATMGCAECHDHKFDPISTKDFYGMAAFFADVHETPVGKREPGMLLASDEQAAELKRFDDSIAGLKQKLNTDTTELAAAQAEWEGAVRELAAAETSEDKPNPQEEAVARPRRNRRNSAPSDRYKPAKEILDIVLIDANKRSDGQRTKVAAYYRTIAMLLEPLRSELATTEKKRTEFYDQIPKTLVSVADKPREMRVLPRGNWLDDSGEVVSPAVPHFLRQLDVAGRPASRMDLALWLTSRDNPLVARVFVNRLWMLLFGQGISRSMEDFGAQGEWPTNPELLDWLAVEFMDSGWDVKRLVRTMVTSRTYRLTSVPTAEQKSRDPLNRYFARQARWRLDAEMVRDNALAVSGLLVLRIGGESAKPYQPSGYWDFLNFPKRSWRHDSGEAQYRRGLYTFWQRTFLHPSMLAFDAPTREECTAERVRSNVPQQALVLLNDPSYVEAARTLAERVLREASSSDDERLNWLYQRVLSRPPKGEERTILIELLSKHRRQYSSDKDAAAKVISTGLAPVVKDLDAVELAAWTSVTRAVLNLHETISRN